MYWKVERIWQKGGNLDTVCIFIQCVHPAIVLARLKVKVASWEILYTWQQGKEE